MILRLTRDLAEQLVANARSAAPHEACGVLIGRDDRLTSFISIPNTASAPERAFVLEPSALVKAIASAEASGQEVLGFYHSHTQHGGQPSTTDIREWNYPDLRMVIISLANNKIAAWQVRDAEVTPVEIVFDDSTQAPEIPLSTAGKTAIIVSVVLAILAVLIISLTLLPPAPPIP